MLRRLKSPENSWRLLQSPPRLTQEIAAACGVSPVVASILIHRGINSPAEARAFLTPSLEDLSDPFLLRDMEAAAQRLAQAIRRGEKILIYGDYDADGVTATALLHTVLTQLGGHPSSYIPDRMSEGYGLNLEALACAKREGMNLVVAVDCGIRSLEEAEFAKSQGLELIILDHHLPGPVLPSAVAAICPKRTDCSYPFKDLAAVGLAFKLAQALIQTLEIKTNAFYRAFLDLVCLGTLGDAVPLIGENRTLVKQGLEALSGTKKPGLISLMQSAGVAGNISARTASFALVPRLNAAGRVKHALLALNLLLSREPGAAAHLAQELEKANQERQKEQRKVIQEALFLLESLPEEDKILVLWSQGWHEGVVGIVASRLAEETGRPAIILTCKDGEAKGSARSVPGFNIVQALENCGDLLLRCGGHAQAAGLALLEGDLVPFKERINVLAEALIGDESVLGALEVDAELPLSQATLALLEQIEALAPFGEGNPEPLFLAEGVIPSNIRRIGNDQSHLTFNVSSPDDNSSRRCVAFGLGSLADEIKEGQPLSLLFHLRADDFNPLYPQLSAVAIKPASG